MLTGIVNLFHAKGLTARVAVAYTWGAARACARATARQVIIVPPGQIVRAVERLPISLLRLPEKIVGDLLTLGFKTVGELSATPRAPLALRFGPEIGRRLDQTFGRMPEPVDPIRTPDQIEVSRSLSKPIGVAESINKYVGRLVAQLCDELERRGPRPIGGSDGGLYWSVLGKFSLSSQTRFPTGGSGIILLEAKVRL